MGTLKVNSIQDQSGNSYNTVVWQSVVTADGSTNTNAVAGQGYFIDTTSASHTVVLPTSPNFGDTIIIADYASTFATYNVTVDPGSNKIEADTTDATLSTNDQTHTLVYTDSTQGWKIVNQDTATDIQNQLVSATGGTVTTSGDYKVHTFTGDGCFVVSTAGDVDYLVVAGGGGGGCQGGGGYAGGGGAGGFRVSNQLALPAATTSPLANPTGIPVSVATYPVTVGSGGAAGRSVPGSNSSFSTITAAGGGGGGAGGQYDGTPGNMGGSGGGGAGNCGSGGIGNAPIVSPPQGNPGGNGNAYPQPPAGGLGGGGGGASTAGGIGNSTPTGPAGDGGTGSYVSPSFAVSCAGTPGPVPSVRYFAGGGGGGANSNACAVQGAGGAGGGGQGSPGSVAGGANTGGGGGGASHPAGSPNSGSAGGKGVVIIRYKFQ